MTDYMLLFRHALSADAQPSPEEIQASMKQWQDWIGGIAAQGKFVSTNMLSHEGKVLKAGGMVTDGPFVEIRETLGGYLTLKAESMEDALTLANGCPIFSYGGNVEIRPIMELPN